MKASTSYTSVSTLPYVDTDKEWANFDVNDEMTWGSGYNNSHREDDLRLQTALDESRQDAEPPETELKGWTDWNDWKRVIDSADEECAVDMRSNFGSRTSPTCHSSAAWSKVEQMGRDE